MRVTIVKPDNMVYLDGRAFSVDCSAIPFPVNVVQWNGAKGWIEFNNEDTTQKTYRGNQPIISMDEFQPFIDAAVALRDEPE